MRDASALVLSIGVCAVALVSRGIAASTAGSHAVKAGIDRTVTVTQGTNLSATVAPDQSRLIVDLQGTLWSVSFKGGSAKRLTDPFLEPARPDFSPRGDRITFEAYKNGTFHIWTMAPDGSGLRQITEGHGDDREPRYSPDGSKIAFSSDRAFKGSYDIWIVDPASGKLTQWTSSPADEYEPAWSPDGNEIAFVSGTGANGTAIRAMNGARVERTLITAPEGAHLDSPTWLKNDKIAYTQISGGKAELMISGSRVGTAEDVFPFPAASLPNDRILYTADGGIHVSDLKTGETRKIGFEAQFPIRRPSYSMKAFDLEPTNAKPVLGIVSPTLSPDGKRIVFESLNQLWLMDIDGKPEALTKDAFYKEDPSWSPDGKRIAYSSDKAGIENIYVLDLETKQESRAAPSVDSAQVGSAWSPDGKMIAFQDQDGGTYVVDLESGHPRRVIDRQFAPSKPTWAARGDAISIGALKPYTRRFREGTSQILTVNLKTGALQYSEPAPFASLSTRGEDGPVYSPDGRMMAFVMNDVLWVRPVDENGIPEGPARQITREVTDAPTWSGDSQHVLYLCEGKLRLTDLNGSETRTVPVDLTWKSPAASKDVFIHAGLLWDGRGAQTQSDVDLVVSNKRIRSIRPHSDEAQRAAAASGAQVVDATHLTVIPGLWESHTHEWIQGKFYGARLGRLWLAYGVTELQSQGDPDYRSVETREAYGSGARLGPRFFATGEAIDGERVYYNFMRPVISDAQLKLELERAKALDYDNLKTYVRLPHAMQKQVAAFGHEQMGVTTASHYMLPGLAYGVDGISHVSATARTGFAYTRSAGGASYEDITKLFSASQEYMVSTPFESFPLYAEDPQMVDDVRLLTLNTPWEMAVLRLKRDLALGKHPVVPPAMHLTPGDPAVLLDALRKEEATIAAVMRGGGLVLAGTDSPLDNVATALHLNLRAQVKFGFKPWEALQTATIMPARAFGRDGDLGTLEPGKLADLVLVEGNPLSDIKAAANVKSVMKSGKIYPVTELMEPYTRKASSR